MYFGSNEYIKTLNKIPIEGQLIYQDDKSSYVENICINVADYATIYSLNSETEDLLNAIKNQTKELKGIKEQLSSIPIESFNKPCEFANNK